ncbi:MAG TPA: LytTR family DNA-binding domain-containing protein [Polyangiaceae bacterium]
MSASHDAPLRVMVVDDEPLARDLVSRLLAADPEVSVVGEATGIDAASAIAATHAEIAFLDVRMPEVDGFGVLERLGEAAPIVVFVTAYDQYALRAFDIHAIDYVLKPIEDARFRVALDRAKSRARERRREGDRASAPSPAARPGDVRARFLVPWRGRSIVVTADQIDWIEATDYYVSLHVSSPNGRATHLLRRTMDELERELDPARFVRVHRSAIVNLDRVAELHPQPRGDCVLLLQDGARVRVSRSRRGQFDEAFASPARRR